MSIIRRTLRDESGMALVLFIITFMLVQIIGLGLLTVVASDLHGAIGNQLAARAAGLGVADAVRFVDVEE